MLGCIQPMSSPMMNTMFGFAGVCAAAGVLPSPDSDISIVALSSVAQECLYQLTVAVDAAAVSGGLSFGPRLNMASLSLLIAENVSVPRWSDARAILKLPIGAMAPCGHQASGLG